MPPVPDDLAAMTTTTITRVEHLIADAAAFIDRAPLHEYGANVYTVQEVLDEVTSKRQRADLAALPYQLRVETVFPEHVRFVADFAKKTGDYPSLSLTDIKVIALACQVHRRECGSDGLRAEPAGKSVVFAKRPVAASERALVGFYDPDRLCDRASRLNIGGGRRGSREHDITDSEDRTSADDSRDGGCNQPCIEGVDEYKVVDEDDGIEIEVEEDEETEDEDDDDGGGWITERNIKKRNENANDEAGGSKTCRVGCVTTDYAVQNVLKQIGLSVVALDGRVISEVRTWIRRCYGCFALTSNMTRAFCPKCGNKSLKRVAVHLDEDGRQRVYVNGKRPLNMRGKKFSLPKPQGGKHAVNPRLVEDQPMPHQRPSRLAKTKTNALDPDYIARLSPFATKDVYSKSAMLGFRGSSQKQWMKRNPNESNKKCKK